MNKTTEALKLAELVEASAEEYMGEDGMVMVIPLDLYNDLIGALAAIREELSDHSGDDYENMTDDELADLQFTRAIAREALAEPVKQEPVAFKFPREPKPENAMGWTVDYGLIRDIAEAIGDQEFHPGYEGIELTLIALEIIYAAPVSAKREWVDLTDDEEYELAKQSEGKSRHWLVGSAIAAFKEKNK